MKPSIRLFLMLGLAHGLSDGAVGFLLGSLLISLGVLPTAPLALLYNALAFALQPLAGLWMDQNRLPLARLLSAGLCLGGLACLLLPLQPAISIFLLGAGSSLLHAAGGGLAISASPGRALGPGFFAAPGVLGLALGGALAASSTLSPAGQPGLSAAWLPALCLISLAAFFLFAKFPALPSPTQDPPALETIFQGHERILLLLVASFALRSAVWTTFQALLQGEMPVLLGLGAAAALGKLLGGPLADRLGWRRWGVGSLVTAALLLPSGERSPFLFMAGIFLLQSSTPVLLAAAGHEIPGHPATAAALILGLATILGGLPAWLGLSQAFAAPAVLLLATAASAAAIWGGLCPQRQTHASLRSEML